MSVTGHKSVSSLAVYQRVGESEKIAMGDALAQTLSPASTSSASASENMLVPVYMQSLAPSSSKPEGTVQDVEMSVFGPLELEEFDNFIGPDSAVVQRRPLQRLLFFIKDYSYLGLFCLKSRP